jgi:predicted TIM-barrel fold metal-dependent hydrolase
VPIVDAQIHLWTSDTAPPHHWRAPYLIDDALREMDAAGIDRAVNCPAVWDPDSNNYAVEAARLHPDRFATLGWFSLDDQAAPTKVDEWLAKPGMLGLRFIIATPEAWAKFVTGELDWLFEAAHDREIALGLMAPPAGFEQLGALAANYPNARLLIDHLSVSPFAKLPDAIDHFFWGTDYTRMHCSWRECLTMFSQRLSWLSDADKEWVLGRGICEWISWDS